MSEQEIRFNIFVDEEFRVVLTSGNTEWTGNIETGLSLAEQIPATRNARDKLQSLLILTQLGEMGRSMFIDFNLNNRNYPAKLRIDRCDDRIQVCGWWIEPLISRLYGHFDVGVRFVNSKAKGLDAETLVADAIVNCSLEVDRFEIASESYEISFLFNKLKRLIYLELKARRSSSQGFTADAYFSTETPSKVARDEEDRWAIERVIGELRTTERIILALKRTHRPRDVAQLVGKSVGHVYRLAKSAMDSIRDRL